MNEITQELLWWAMTWPVSCALECLTYDDGWVSTWLDDEDADDEDEDDDNYDLQLLLDGSLNSHVHILHELRYMTLLVLYHNQALLLICKNCFYETWPSI